MSIYQLILVLCRTASRADTKQPPYIRRKNNSCWNRWPAYTWIQEIFVQVYIYLWRSSGITMWFKCSTQAAVLEEDLLGRLRNWYLEYLRLDICAYTSSARVRLEYSYITIELFSTFLLVPWSLFEDEESEKKETLAVLRRWTVWIRKAEKEETDLRCQWTSYRQRSIRACSEELWPSLGQRLKSTKQNQQISALLSSSWQELLLQKQPRPPRASLSTPGCTNLHRRLYDQYSRIHPYLL